MVCHQITNIQTWLLYYIHTNQPSNSFPVPHLAHFAPKKGKRLIIVHQYHYLHKWSPETQALIHCTLTSMRSRLHLHSPQLHDRSTMRVNLRWITNRWFSLPSKRIRNKRVLHAGQKWGHLVGEKMHKQLEVGLRKKSRGEGGLKP